MIPPTRTERGSVIFYILIAIVAFAALSMAVSRSGRDSAGTVDREKSDLAATEIFDYANALRASIQNMMIQGTKQTQLCFDNTAWGNTDFVYAACSIDKNKVFGTQGGNAPVQHGISTTLLERGAVGSVPQAGIWYFTGNMRIRGVGQDCDPQAGCNEIVAVLKSLRQQVCIALNTKLGIANPQTIPVNTTPMTLTPYIGTLTYDADSVVSAAALVGRRSGCFKDPAGPYTFYAVLAAN